MGLTMRRTGVLVCVLLLLMNATPLTQASPVHLPLASEEGPSDQIPLQEHGSVPLDDSESSSPGGSPSHPEHPSILQHSSRRQQTFEAGMSNDKDRKKDLLYNTVSATLKWAVQLPERKAAAHPSRSSKISKRSVNETVEDVFKPLPSFAMFLPADASREERERAWRKSANRDRIKQQFYSLQEMFINMYNNINQQLGSLRARPRSHQRFKRSDRSVEDVFTALPENAMFLPRDASEEERDQSLRTFQKAREIRDQFYNLQEMFTNMYNNINQQLGSLQARLRSHQRSKRSDRSVEDVFTALPENAMFLPRDASEEERDQSLRTFQKARGIRDQFYNLQEMFTNMYNNINKQLGSLRARPRSHQRSKRSDRSVEDVFTALPENAMFLPRDASEEERDQSLQTFQKAREIRDQFYSLQEMFINMYNNINKKLGSLRARLRSHQRSKRSDRSPVYAMFHPTEVKREKNVNIIPEAVKEVQHPPSSTSPLRVDASQEGRGPSGQKPTKQHPVREEVGPVTETVEDIQRLPSSTTSLPVDANQAERDPSGQKPIKEHPVIEQFDPVVTETLDVFQPLPSSATSLPVGASRQEKERRQQKSVKIIEQFRGLQKIYAKMYEWIRQGNILRSHPATGDQPQIKKRDTIKNYVIPHPNDPPAAKRSGPPEELQKKHLKSHAFRNEAAQRPEPPPVDSGSHKHTQ